LQFWKNGILKRRLNRANLFLERTGQSKTLSDNSVGIKASLRIYRDTRRGIEKLTRAPNFAKAINKRRVRLTTIRRSTISRHYNLCGRKNSDYLSAVLNVLCGARLNEQNESEEPYWIRIRNTGSSWAVIEPKWTA